MLPDESMQQAPCRTCLPGLRGYSGGLADGFRDRENGQSTQGVCSVPFKRQFIKPFPHDISMMTVLVT